MVPESPPDESLVTTQISKIQNILLVSYRLSLKAVHAYSHNYTFPVCHACFCVLLCNTILFIRGDLSLLSAIHSGSFFLSNTRGQSHVQILSWPMSPTFQMFLLLFPLVLFACTWAQLVAGSAPAPEESSACTTAACIWARLRVEQGLNRNSATKQSSTIHLRRPAGTATAAGRLYYQEKMSTAQRGAGI